MTDLGWFFIFLGMLLFSSGTFGLGRAYERTKVVEKLGAFMEPPIFQKASQYPKDGKWRPVSIEGTLQAWVKSDGHNWELSWDKK